MRPRASQIHELLSTQSQAEAARREIYMEDIKLWELNGTLATQLASNNRLESELLLENTLVENPGLLMEDLTLVGRQTPTEGGPLDLLGIDGDGRLVVFELKRGTLSRDAVAQIIDYASDLDDMDLDALAEHIAEGSGTHGIEEIEDFQEWYVNRGFDDLGSLKPLRMFLIGLGADDRTERMVRFLAENSGMDISLLTFHGFVYNDKTILAKQVEVEAATEPEQRSKRKYVSMAERRARLERMIEGSGVSDIFEAARAMFQENWPGSRPRPGAWGLNIPITGRQASYARIGAGNERISIVFFPWAKELCVDEFRQPVEKIPYDTWPRNGEPLEDPKTEIQFRLTPEVWETHKESLTALVQSIYVAWKNKGQDDGVESG